MPFFTISKAFLYKYEAAALLKISHDWPMSKISFQKIFFFELKQVYFESLLKIQRTNETFSDNPVTQMCTGNMPKRFNPF